MIKAKSKDEHKILGLFERHLTIWVGLSIIFGIGLGILFPDFFHSLSLLQYANVNFIVALLIWMMIYPMMIKVDFSSIKKIKNRPKGLFLTTIINWVVKPFTMAALGVYFFEVVFQTYINAQDAKQYIAGIVLLGAAPCTAMVFVWSELVRGDPTYTLIQVSVNDIIMIFAFAPIVSFLLGVTDITVPWETLFTSVLIYVVVPLAVGLGSRKYLIKSTSITLEQFTERLKPLSAIGLLTIVILLFGFQAELMIKNPIIIILIAIPLIIQTYGIFLITYSGAWILQIPHKIAAPSALIGTSNFFELAVAVAISVFGLNSGAALATIVGVLVEVPIMLSLVGLSNRTKKWFIEFEDIKNLK